jgi:hypothetical protein
MGNMKWFGLVITLIVGGVAFYYIYHGSKPKPGTPHATVQAYIDAARKGDEAAIRALCTAAAAGDAVRLAPQVRAMMAGGGPVGLQPMKSDPPRRGLCALVGGKMLGIQLIEENGQWKIVEIGISGD